MFTIAMTYSITHDRVIKLQHELLENNLTQVLSMAKLHYQTIDSLGMSNVKFYKETTQQDVLNDIEKNLAPGTSLAIINKATNQLVFSGGTSKPQTLDEMATLLQPKKHKQYWLPFISIESNKPLANIKEYPEWNWEIISYISDNLLLEYISSALKTSLLVSGYFLLIVFIMFFYFSKQMSKAINKLQEGAKRFAKNNFDSSIKVKVSDEFSSLATSLNQMAREISLTQDKLQASAFEQQQANQALEISKKQQVEALLGADLGQWDYNFETKTLNADQRSARIIGRSSVQELTSPNNWLTIIHPEDAAKVQEMLRSHLKLELSHFKMEVRLLHTNGDWIWVVCRGSVIERDTNSRALRMSGTLLDICQRKQDEAQLKLAASVFNHANEGILIIGLDKNIIDVNQAFLTISGFKRDQLIGQSQDILRPININDKKRKIIRTHLKENRFWSGEIEYTRCNGEIYTVSEASSVVLNELSEVQHYVTLITDITELKQHQQKLEHLAHYDSLTSLPNHSMLLEFLSHGLETATQHHQYLAVVYIDIDNFKRVNDLYGEEIGDQVLINLAKRMQQCIGKDNLLARVGGDDFVAIFTGLSNSKGADEPIKKLQHAVSQVELVDQLKIQVSASLGTTFYPQVHQQISAEQLLRQANQAMFEAKLIGTNCVRSFDDRLEQQIRGRHESLAEVTRALDNHEFELFYQPKVNLKLAKVVGVEALVRWRHPSRGLIGPKEFLATIEYSPKMITDLGRWVIQQSLKQIDHWQGLGVDIPVSINVHAVQLQQPDFIDELKRLLLNYPNVQPSLLELEILESSALEDLQHCAAVIAECKRLGISFALDDFGTGYSSLTYLRQLDISIIKIDQSFVMGMLDNPNDYAIVEGVIGLAKAFKLKVIAEGVESSAHCQCLIKLGCELAQGYGIAEPMPADNLVQWVAEWEQHSD